MNDTDPLVPAGISHEPDIAAMSPQERLAHCRAVAFHQGILGFAALKAAHPELSLTRIHSVPVAYQRKPPGYPDALVALVSRWFDSEGAKAATNRADVEELNAKLGTSFNPANHFSKPLSASVLKKLAALFAERGGHLDTRQVSTMSAVRKAVSAATSGRADNAVPFGSWGIRRDDSLTVAGRSFAIEQHNGKDCIRISVDGSRLRLRLDALSEFLAATGLAPSAPSHTTTCSIGELAPDPISGGNGDPLGGSLPENWSQAKAAPADLHRELDPRTLRDRIQRLVCANKTAEQPTPVDGADPLALI